LARNPWVIGLGAVVLVQALIIGLIVGRITNNPAGTPAAASGKTAAHPPATTTPPAGGAVTATSPLSPTTGDVVFSSRFGHADGWDVGQIAPHASGRITSAGYVLTGTGNLQHLLPAPTGTFPAISSAETSAVPATLDGVGSQCFSGFGVHPDLYQLDIHSDGQWWLQSRLGAGSWSGAATNLRAGDIGYLTAPPTVEITCVTLSLTGTTAEMRIAAFVDGHLLADLTSVAHDVDPAGWEGGVFFETQGTSSVTFTRFVARQLAT
jgi:hypothetical protein